MPLLTWTNRLSVGVAELDAQHQRLIELLNQLYDAMHAGEGAKVLGSILDSLIEYTGVHFAMEEEIMSRHGFPGCDSHHEEHEALAWKAKELRERFDEEGPAMLTVETLTFLKTWLTTHILGTDMKYRAFFAEHGVK